MNALVKKLRIKPETPVVVLNMPVNCAYLFDSHGITTTKPRTEKIAQLVFFAKDAASLASKFVPLVPSLTEDPLVWIIYPKKSGSIKSDLSMTRGWQPVFDTGLTGVSSAAINDDWTALRLRPEASVRGALAPPESRVTEGIDYVKRTVVLPADALKMVKKFPGMDAYFDALAFTHKKEHVVAIADAKKTETRARRIEKMIEMLNAGMKAKKK